MVKTCFRRAQPGGDILEVTYEKIYSYNLRHVRVGCHGCQQRQVRDHVATTARSAKLSLGERTAQTGVWMLYPSDGCNETPSRGRDVCNHWTLCPLHPGLSPDKHHTNITRSTHNNKTMNASWVCNGLVLVLSDWLVLVCLEPAAFQQLRTRPCGVLFIAFHGTHVLGSAQSCLSRKAMLALAWRSWNKCIADDTKVAARQSPNCIRNKK